MSNITREIQIEAPRKKVWQILADIGSVQDYSPGVVRSYYTSPKKQGVDASRHCDLLPAGTVEERIVEWHDGEEYAIEIYEGTQVPYMGVSHFTLKDNGLVTTVMQRMDYKPTDDLPNGLKGKSMARLVDRIIEGNLLGLKHFVETGEVVTREVFKRIR